MSERVIAMIPARAGSERLKFKNLRMLGGQPVISYAIEAAKAAGVFDRIVVNSEHPIFGRLAARYGVEFYQRPEPLGSSEARSDDVVADFMRAYPSDILMWINPIAPLQPAEEIAQVLAHFQAERLDSLITVKDEQVHCLMGGKPLNFSETGLFAKTQDLEPVQAMVYSVMMWRYEAFLAHYQEQGHAVLAGKVGYFPVCRDSQIILKYEDDLRMAEALLAARRGGGAAPAYDPLVDEVFPVK